MKNLVLSNFVNNTSSNEEGDKLFIALNELLHDNEGIIIVVDHNSALASSFLNSSIGQFLDRYGFELFQQRIKFQGNKNQFSKLKNYISEYRKLHYV